MIYIDIFIDKPGQFISQSTLIWYRINVQIRIKRHHWQWYTNMVHALKLNKTKLKLPPSMKSSKKTNPGLTQSTLGCPRSWALMIYVSQRPPHSQPSLVALWAQAITLWLWASALQKRTWRWYLIPVATSLGLNANLASNLVTNKRKQSSTHPNPRLTQIFLVVQPRALNSVLPQVITNNPFVFLFLFFIYINVLYQINLNS